MKIFSLIGLFFILFNISLFAQVSIADYNYLQEFTMYEQHTPTYNIEKEKFQIFDVVFQQLFWAYKHLLSSQDAHRCPFQVSCSEYMIISIQKKGVIPGFLNGVDRVMRCNGLSNEHYAVDSLTLQLIDPVE